MSGLISFGLFGVVAVIVMTALAFERQIKVFTGTFTGWSAEDHVGPRPWFYFLLRPASSWVRIELGIPGRTFYVHWVRRDES